MKFTTKGVVIKEQSISESDRLVTLLTQERGVIRAFARGAKSPKSKKSAGTQLFCYAQFDIYSGGNAFSIEDAGVIETFFELRQDIVRLALAQYLCELMLELAPVEEEAGEVLKLFLNSLAFIVQGKKPPMLIKGIAELRLLTLTGYMPNIVACRECGSYETPRMFFDCAKGELLCENCNKNKYYIPLSSSAVTGMRHVVFSEMDKIFSFNLKGNSLNEFADVCERYLLSVTNKKYKTLDFYKTLV